MNLQGTGFSDTKDPIFNSGDPIQVSRTP